MTSETEQPTEAPAPEVPAAPTRSGWGWLVGLAVLALVVAAGLVAWPRWAALLQPPVASPQAQAPRSDEVESLRAELAMTRERLRQLETRPVGGVAEDPRVPALEAAVRALQAQPQVPARLADEVAELGRQVADLRKSAADAATVLRLADRVEQAEAGVRELSSRKAGAVALLLAVGQLRQAVELGYPFDAELRALKAVAGGDDVVQKAAEALAERSAAGIPTRATLAERFVPLAPQVVRAEALPAADTWWRATLNRLLSLVTIRREDGTAAGESAAAVAARAEARLEQGDLAGAARELGALSGPPAEVAGPWMSDARWRVSAERALSELTAHAVALTGAGR